MKNTVFNNYLSVLVVLSSAVIVRASGTSAASPAPNPLKIMVHNDVLSVYENGRMILRYRCDSNSFRPYVEQLFSPAGVNILRDAPADHLHHHGLMFAITVDGVNFWEQQQNCGRQVHRGFDDVNTGAFNALPRAAFTEHIDWLAPDSTLLLKETRTLEIHRLKNTRATFLTWRSQFEVPPGKASAVLTGKHYHGLGMRFLKSMDAQGPFFNADGTTGEVVRGDERLAKSRWCAYTAQADNTPVTVAMFDDPNNLRSPAAWFTMAKPFAYLSATMNLHRESFVLTARKPLLLRYAVAVWDVKADAKLVEQFYRQWLSPCSPTASKGNN